MNDLANAGPDRLLTVAQVAAYLQFHPESYLTADGMTFIRNFLRICDSRR